MKTNRRTIEKLSPEIGEAFERLQEAFSDLWPLMGERIDQECPALTNLLNEFVARGGHFRFVYRFRPEVKLVLEALMPDGTTREVYQMKARDRVREGARDAAQPVSTHH